MDRQTEKSDFLNLNTDTEYSDENSTTSDTKRDTWSGRFDFLFACVGFAVGLGNIWRFPYLCYKNGGGAFLIPYLIMLVGGGIPVLILEIGLGQFMSQGGLMAWKICPLFQGIGVATIVVDFLMNIYYIIILAWGLYYFGMSLTSVLPWSHCNNTWNTERCSLTSSDFNSRCHLELNSTVKINRSMDGIASYNSCALLNVTPVDPAVEFWERKVLQITDSIEDSGGIVWELAICLLAMWIVVYLSVWRGVKWTGKVVYFTASFPYLILVTLLIRGITLPGAVDGIKFYLKPDFSRLADPQVWIDGGTQIFFSYAIAIGAMISLGSYNKFNNNFYKDCIIISCVNSGTSLLGGFAVFSVLGYMANQQNVSIDKVADSGPGLAFVVYPKAVTQMPLSPLWSILFFFMLFLIGLDSQFVAVESFVTQMSDLCPRYLYNKKGRMIFTAIYCFISYLFGLSMISRGGMYVFQLFDYYSASGLILLWLCFWESIVVGWIFGAERFYDAIEEMIGFRINIWLHICWKYITPIITSAIFIYHIVDFKPLKYNKTYVYPTWAQVFGMSLAFVSISCVPIFMIWKLLTTKGSFIQRLRTSTRPCLMEHQICKSWKRDDNCRLESIGYYSK